MAGKGDSRRPHDRDRFAANYDRVFGRPARPAAGRRRFVVHDGRLAPVGATQLSRRRSEIRSFGAGVLPEQVPEARRFCRGIDGIDFNADGDVIARTPKAFDRYLARRGFDPL